MNPVPAWCLVNGEWTERDDPVMAACDPDGGDVCAAMAALGFEAWCRIGDEETRPGPLTLAVFSRERPPLQFLLQLEGNAGDVVEHVFAEALPDAMNLLAAWAPIAQAGALVELVRRSVRDEGGTSHAVRRRPMPPWSPPPPQATPSATIDRVGS